MKKKIKSVNFVNIANGTIEQLKRGYANFLASKGKGFVVSKYTETANATSGNYAEQKLVSLKNKICGVDKINISVVNEITLMKGSINGRMVAQEVVKKARVSGFYGAKEIKVECKEITAEGTFSAKIFLAEKFVKEISVVVQKIAEESSLDNEQQTAEN